MDVNAHVPLTSAVVSGESQLHASAALPWRKEFPVGIGQEAGWLVWPHSRSVRCGEMNIPDLWVLEIRHFCSAYSLSFYQLRYPEEWRLLGCYAVWLL
jgi:hypothetical protein